MSQMPQTTSPRPQAPGKLPLPIQHRVNTLTALRATPTDLGVEVDVRYEGDRLILHHDPFVQGEDFEKFLGEYKHRTLILNIKSEGIEQKAIELVESFGIKDYFLLDVSFPFMIKLSNKGMRKLAVRFSEFESIDTCLAMAGRAEWVFVDVFTRLPLDDSAYSKLSKKFKICVVSPELLGREADADSYKELFTRKGYKIDAVLTKNPARWRL